MWAPPTRSTCLGFRRDLEKRVPGPRRGRDSRSFVFPEPGTWTHSRARVPVNRGLQGTCLPDRLPFLCCFPLRWLCPGAPGVRGRSTTAARGSPTAKPSFPACLTIWQSGKTTGEEDLKVVRKGRKYRQEPLGWPQGSSEGSMVQTLGLENCCSQPSSTS